MTSITSVQELKPGSSPKLDVFVFPGDSNLMASQDGSSDPASADHSDENDDGDFSEDEFCILDHPQKEQEVKKFLEYAFVAANIRCFPESLFNQTILSGK